MAASSKKVIIAALLGNSAISITKFAAAAVTGSSAMISEGIHSLVDTGNQILLLHGLRRAKRPASSAFPQIKRVFVEAESRRTHDVKE